MIRARAYLGVLFLLTLWLAPAKASAEEIAVQLNAIAIPAITEKGYTGRTTVTPYLNVQNADGLQKLCSRLPRLTDLLLVAFQAKPVKLGQLESELAARQDEFRKMFDETIGTGVFGGIYMVQGSKQRGEGTEIISVDGARRECQPIAYLPWEKPRSAKSGKTSNVAGPAMVEKPELTEEQLDAAEAELLAVDTERKRVFPNAPERPKSKAPSWVMIALVSLGFGGLLLITGSYIGYQVAKIRRDRRRRDRRLKKKERRTGTDRRKQNLGPPDGDDKRAIDERRGGDDRRQAVDRRMKQDRRD